MPYDRDSFLAGIAVGRNMMGWPNMLGIKAFSMTVDSSIRAGIEFFIYLARGITIELDWGDGSAIESYTGATDDSATLAIASHRYSENGIYHIKIDGEIQRIHFQYEFADTRDMVISVDSPFVVANNYHPTSYLNLDSWKNFINLRHIPSGLYDGYADTQLFIYYPKFTNCQSLKTVPHKLFAKNLPSPPPFVPSDFEDFFQGCTSLKNVPDDVFNDATLQGIRDASGMFDGCSSLESIPAEMIRKMTALEDASSMFRNCTSLEEVPTRLFGASVSGCYGTFAGCTGLVGLPSELFYNCLVSDGFGGCFDGCSSLLAIPHDLFDYSPQAVGFVRCFADCTSLMSIPLGLFDNVGANPVFTNCFNGCVNITSPVPELWTISGATGYGCFSGCVNAANYADIPRDWK